jgi:uncharacterized protein YqgC (DUF456 family)
MDFFYDFGALWLALFFMTIGLVGIAVPFFPGLLIIWISGLGYGLLVGFGIPGTVIMVLMTVALIFGSVVDNFFSGAGALRGGASWLAIGAGVLAGIIGTFAFPPIGGFITAPLAVLGVESLRRRNVRKAFDATRGWAVGCGWAYAARLLTGILMIELFVIWVLLTRG